MKVVDVVCLHESSDTIKELQAKKQMEEIYKEIEAEHHPII